MKKDQVEIIEMSSMFPEVETIDEVKMENTGHEN